MSGKNATETVWADDAGIARAARIVRGGGIVAVPTETVYGLAARADDAAAVARIYHAKGRPGTNPLIVHVDTFQQAETLAHFSDAAKALAARYWPGPLTLVLPLLGGAPVTAAGSAGLPTIAVRMPAHAAMRALIRESGCPLAAPSANRSNAVSPTSAAHVAATLDGRIDLILDAGPCEKGVESTIVAVRHDGTIDVLRPGPITIEATAGRDAASAVGGRLEAPGQMASHYSPGKPVRLNADSAQADEYLIGFGHIAGHDNLSASADLEEAAGALYAALHRAGDSGFAKIAVAPVPHTGVGIAINDRLRRAAA